MLPLVTDANDWSPGFGKTFVPHARSGPVANVLPNPGDQSFASVTSGSIGLLDGSVHWKNISAMEKRQGSRLWSDEGCFALW